MVVGGRGEEKAKVESGGGWFVGGLRREPSAGAEDEAGPATSLRQLRAQSRALGIDVPAFANSLS